MDRNDWALHQLALNDHLAHDLAAAVAHVREVLERFDDDKEQISQNLGREPIPGVHETVSNVRAAALRRIVAEFDQPRN